MDESWHRRLRKDCSALLYCHVGSSLEGTKPKHMGQPTRCTWHTWRPWSPWSRIPISISDPSSTTSRTWSITSPVGDWNITLASRPLVFPPDPDVWVNILIQIDDNLPVRVKGAAYWVEYDNRDESCYHIHMTDKELAEVWVEFINHKWYLIFWFNDHYWTKGKFLLDWYLWGLG